MSFHNRAGVAVVGTLLVVISFVGSPGRFLTLREFFTCVGGIGAGILISPLVSKGRQ